MPRTMDRLATAISETNALVRRLRALVVKDQERLTAAGDRNHVLFHENAELQARVDALAEELEAERLAHEVAEEHRRRLRFALESALAVWCDGDPGSGGTDGDTYRLCHAALDGVADWRDWQKGGA